MKRNRICLALTLVACATLLIAQGGLPAAADPANAAPRNGYEISWYTVDGGYTFSTGGTYSLGGTIGQADAGALNGGTYTLNGGFWIGDLFRLFLPLILR
jgi:hypothetical protein